MTARSNHARLGLGLLLLILRGAGCSSLPTHHLTFCDMSTILGPFHIDPSANPPTWAERPGGRRINLRWPAGFSLKTVDGVAEVLDAQGTVVMTSGHPYPGMLSGSWDTAGWFDVCEVSVEP
jgi:hypothetical protein